MEANSNPVAPSKTKLVWGLLASSTSGSAIAADKALRIQRAERFSAPVTVPTFAPAGTQQADPRGLVEYDNEEPVIAEIAPRRDAGAGGISTGLDLFTEEEIAKRTARADRFQCVTNTVLQYLPDAEDEIRRKRAERFGTTSTTAASIAAKNVYPSQYPQTHVGRDEQRREHAIHVHGVDLLNSSQVMDLFTNYGPTHVEWLSASSANVIFTDAHCAKRAMVARGQPILPSSQQQQQQDSAPAGASESVASTDPTHIVNLPFLWHKLTPTSQPTISNAMSASSLSSAPSHPTPRLTFRMATVVDMPDPAQPMRQRGPKWRPPRAPRTAAAGNSSSSAGTSGGGKRGREDPDGDVEMDGDDEDGDDVLAGGDDVLADGDVEMAAGGGVVAGADGDGDVEMKRTRGERGGRRVKARKLEAQQGPSRMPFYLPVIDTSRIPVVSFFTPKLDYTDLDDEPPQVAPPAPVQPIPPPRVAPSGYSRGSGAGSLGPNRPASRAAGPPPRPTPAAPMDLRTILQRHRLRNKNTPAGGPPAGVSAPGVEFGRRAFAAAGLVKLEPQHH